METWLTQIGTDHSLGEMEVLYSLSVSFVLGLVLATVYRWTHQSFSYARSFLHTMVLATIVITVMIMAIGNNMARGLGIMGAMAFVRFRTPIRDPRDIIFLFARPFDRNRIRSSGVLSRSYWHPIFLFHCNVSKLVTVRFSPRIRRAFKIHASARFTIT